MKLIIEHTKVDVAVVIRLADRVSLSCSGVRPAEQLPETSCEVLIVKRGLWFLLTHRQDRALSNVRAVHDVTRCGDRVTVCILQSLLQLGCILEAVGSHFARISVSYSL